jgi:hypothetical protein
MKVDAEGEQGRTRREVGLDSQSLSFRSVVCHLGQPKAHLECGFLHCADDMSRENLYLMVSALTGIQVRWV